MFAVSIGTTNTTRSFNVSDIAMKSANTSSDRRYSGEPQARISADTVRFTRNLKQTQTLKKPVAKKSGSTFGFLKNFKLNLNFNYENLIKTALMLVILFGLYVLGGIALLILFGIGVASYALFNTLGLIPDDLMGASGKAA